VAAGGARAQITLTVDVEDYAPPGEDLRAEHVTDELLGFLATRSIRGTFFIVGELAEQLPSLVRAIADGGHEIALHGWEHRPLADIEPDTLRADLKKGKDTLEQLAQQPVVGFRAPMFSLVPSTHGVLDMLVDAGFSYSSSVLPARSVLWGDATAPRHPFRWPNGLHELPCPIATFGPLANPYLGGAYLRVLPHLFVRYGLARAKSDEILWLYCHPYDLDPGEPYRPRPELGRHATRLMWLGRSRMLTKIDRVLNGRAAPPLRERLPRD
jgi:polysaccharide deacetylase family protein (PEP-CTERM system associated)